MWFGYKNSWLIIGRRWTLTVDGQKIRGRFLMWEAMNTRTVGPVLKLAPKARTDDSRLELVLVHERDREILLNYLSKRLQSKRRSPFPLSARQFRKLIIDWRKTLFHFDADLWPEKGQKIKRQPKIEITVKESALMISRPVKLEREKLSPKGRPAGE